MHMPTLCCVTSLFGKTSAFWTLSITMQYACNTVDGVMKSHTRLNSCTTTNASQSNFVCGFSPFCFRFFYKHKKKAILITPLFAMLDLHADENK